MKEIIRNLGINILAALVLLSSISWSLQEHYCMGRLVDISIFAESHGCGMEMDLGDTESDGEKKSSCCDDEITLFDGQDQFKYAKDQLEIVNPSFLDIWYNTYTAYAETSPKFIPPPYYHPPPPLIEDIQLLDEVFLI